MSEFTKQIEEVIANNKQYGGFISINGYKTKTGKVSNIQVTTVGATYYLNKIKENIDFIENGEVENLLIKTDDVELWKKAVEQQLKSYKKTLAGEQDRVNNYSKLAKNGFYDHTKSDDVYIKNIVVVNRKVLEKGEIKVVNSKPLTLLKARIRKGSPLSKSGYCATYKLSENNVKSVSWAKEKVTS